MNRKVKRIERAELASAVKLTALEMNGMHFSAKHTVLTPELLEEMRKGKEGQ